MGTAALRSMTLALALGGFTLLCHQAPAAPGPTWLLSYGGKPTNRVIDDRRTVSLIHESLPAALADKVEGALGGPPDLVQVNAQRYVSMSACFPHACNEKGFFWVDTQTGTALGADADCSYAGEGWGCAIKLGSMGLSGGAIPPEAMQALRAWMAAQKLVPDSLTFVGADGRLAPLETASYAPLAQSHLQ
jgi:hypothetical protein